MYPDRWRRVADVFDAALAQSAGDRASFLASACAGDLELERDVRALLERSDAAGTFLEQPPIVSIPTSTTAGSTTTDLPSGLHTISHYRIVERLGAGGMGVVYKAEDLRLKRPVALKFLPLEVVGDPDAKRRMMHEAQAASALDHPHICTIHEIDESSDGRLFIAMAYYEGETLKQRIARGALSLDEALAIAMQIASAVGAAHDAGIVHRDIKPANIILTRSGVRLLDFGIAKVEGQTNMTRTGGIIGTLTYMSPEQINGLPADARSDVWAIGAVLFEMLAGHPPFAASSDIALMNAIAHDAPRPLRRERPELAADLDRVIARALDKDPARRFPTAGSLAHALAALPSRVRLPPPQGRSRSRIFVPLAAALVLAAFVPGGMWLRGRFDVLEARERTIPEIRRLLQEDAYFHALALVLQAERVLGNEDASLVALRDEVSGVIDVVTSPPGVQVSIRDPQLEIDWRVLGTTPLSVRVPQGVIRWKFEKPGFDTIEQVGPGRPVTGARPGSVTLSISLTAAGETPPRMVRIPAGPRNLDLAGYYSPSTISSSEYYIDRFEVTNREFKAFVDAGGYTDQKFWKHAFVTVTGPISWQAAMTLFKDQTGRAGPSTWEVGTFPSGQEDYPVGGVSWYEAAAYAEFRGKALPTVFHWVHAAGTEYAAAITPLSNMGGSGPLPAGRSAAVSDFGLSDVAGNVKEWVWNEEATNKRYVLGGGWSEPDYLFLEGESRSPFDRSSNIGFRCAQYTSAASAPPEAFVRVAQGMRDYSTERPASDEVFKVYTNQFSYDAAPLDAKVEHVDDSSPFWRRERISYSSAYGKPRAVAQLFLPKGRTAPHQLVLYWPGSNAVRQPKSDDMPTPWDFVVKSGRAVLVPVYYGAWERNDGVRNHSVPDESRAYRDWAIRGVQDARRALDYAATRADLSRERVGYLGSSWGGRMAPVVIAQEPRVKAAVLAGAGLSSGPAPPEVDGFSFAPRMTVPVLMFNGESDLIFERDRFQRPLFNALGTPAEHKRHTVVPGGHTAFIERRSQFIREALDWFDRYLGPVH